MLAHQLPELPPVESYLRELEELFAWLTGVKAEAAPLPAFPAVEKVAPEWAPPPMLSTWGVGVPLEAIRFAGANRLCVDLGYNGSVRRIEPYSIRRSKAGDLLVYAIRTDNREPRAYRVDRIESVRVTKEPFTPVHPIELWPTGPISAPPLAQGASFSSTPRRQGLRRAVALGPCYVVQCAYCGKQFTRRDTKLTRHKMKGQQYLDCPGRTGFVVHVV